VKVSFTHIALSCIVSLMCSLSLGAKEFEEGLDAFIAKDYKISSEMFLNVIGNEPNNSSAYYNLGVVQMQQAKFGEAIWAFENVLKLSPNDSQVKEKIEQCYSELNRPDYWKPHLNSLKSGLYSWSSNVWSILAIAFSLVLFASIVVFRMCKAIPLKRLMIVSGIIGVCCMLTSITLAKKVKQYSEGTHYAMVIRKSIPTFIEKEKKAKTVLNEGTQLSISQPDSTEYMVVTANSGQEHLVRFEDLAFF